jgi:hypothetical protein
MASNRLQVTDLDFDTIKTNLKTFLQGQSEFTDYNFEGSGLNVLLDILAYNTHYNAYYLNMVANESFLDSAILRNSVVSHAKLLSYVPQSTTSPKAIIDLTVPTESSVPDSLTLPRGFSFKTNIIDNTTYNYVLLEDATVDKVGQDFYFKDLEIYEGQIVNYTYTYNQLSNPKGIFTIPDINVDTRSLQVSVQVSSSNLSSAVYTLSEDVLNVTGESEVFFLQEGKDQKYQIYFGNSSVGKALNDGAIVNISYLVTSGAVSNKSTSFVVSSIISGLSNYVVDVIVESSGGSDRESVESIKTNSILSYSTQNRLVTVKDYESYLLKNYPVIDSISVWGGEDEIPPVYGKVFISMKPKTNYFLSSGEKQRIIDELIKPKSMISIQSEIRDPEFLFLKLQNKVRYDKKKTSFTEEQLKNSIKTGIFNYSDTFLDKFGSTLVLSKLQDNIDAVDINSIVGSETILRLEKRFKPVLDSSRTYEVNFDARLHRGTILNRLVSSEFTVNDNTGVTRDAIIEETPESFTGVSSISVSNPGYGYTTTPTVTISGDGFGAEAVAKIVNGKVESIEVRNRGINYTKAVISFSGGNGFGAEAIAVLDARFGTLRTVYFNNLAERQIIDSNVGTIDYETGLVTITNIRILSVTTDDDTLRLDVESEDGIISSKRNTIITIDKFDPSAITTDLTTA